MKTLTMAIIIAVMVMGCDDSNSNIDYYRVGEWDMVTNSGDVFIISGSEDTLIVDSVKLRRDNVAHLNASWSQKFRTKRTTIIYTGGE